jgi:hypothetical protein
MITEPMYSVFHQPWTPQLPWDVPADASILSDKPVVPYETVKETVHDNLRHDLLSNRFCQ